MIAGYLHLLRYGFRFGSYFAAAWGALYIHRWLKRYREHVAQSWPIVQGVVLSGEVKRVRRTSHFHATLQYSYFVGQYRTGKYVHEFSAEADADAFVRLMKDKRVYIRYKQSSPGRSLLEQSVVEQHVLLAPRFDGPPSTPVAGQDAIR